LPSEVYNKHQALGKTSLCRVLEALATFSLLKVKFDRKGSKNQLRNDITNRQDGIMPSY
jgi:hypothetical protein